jgi:acyl-CoA reductase-like NAD-dependent aldehyde dehydrogenase
MASIQRINNFIDGQFESTESYLDSFNPSTEEVIAHIADSSAEDAKRAVDAARRAFPSYVKIEHSRMFFFKFFFCA